MGVIFLDNAATTPLEPRVKEEMIRMMDNFGNPSSTHVSGRGSKIEVEVVRKRIAKTIGAEPSEIFFTSGGTEADNMALFCSVRDLGVKRIITTTIEHHAVGHPVEFMAERGEVEAIYLSVNEHGDIDLNELSIRCMAANAPIFCLDNGRSDWHSSVLPKHEEEFPHHHDPNTNNNHNAA